MTAETETDWADKIGKPAYESIAEMVAALECDYDRLEELRELRESCVADLEERSVFAVEADELNRQLWLTESPDEAEELAELEAAAGDHKSQDDAQTYIQEDVLSVRVFGERVDGEWEADKAELLLSTGGPAVRIMCELDQHGEPSRAWLEVQDWFKPWTQYFGAEQDTLLSYCRQFVYVSE